MLMCNETVTLVRLVKSKKEDHYECTVVSGVSWFAKFTITPDSLQTSNGVHAENVIKVRIPAENMPAGVTPQKGDYLVRGALESVNGTDDLGPHECFKALTIGDNRRGNLKHWAVTGA